MLLSTIGIKCASFFKLLIGQRLKILMSVSDPESPTPSDGEKLEELMCSLGEFGKLVMLHLMLQCYYFPLCIAFTVNIFGCVIH